MTISAIQSSVLASKFGGESAATLVRTHAITPPICGAAACLPRALSLLLASLAVCRSRVLGLWLRPPSGTQTLLHPQRKCTN